MKITAFLTSALAGAVTAADTLYLVNSWKGNEISSGMAYYADGHDATGGTGGSRPDDYVDITHESHIIWEGQPVKGTFGTGVSFTSNIFADAASKHDNAWAGTGTNGYHTYNCWKRTGAVGKPVVLYTVDGWTVETIYYCRPFN
ncbi:myroilysin precursor [Fusarium pseudocircinatum]|uniref:Myroilysin n=1 Tax=Fusarium pseudocircinatum TaxID=56676 RepID=A0A8H5UKS1_9HYPO|nr:myroilysin precursor [Fusarium pseudocircinatum]